METEVRIGEKEFDLGTFLRVFKRYAILLVAVALVFAIFGAVYTAAFEDEIYQASVSFWVNGASNNVSQSATMGAAQMATNYAELVNKDMLLRRAVQNDLLNEKWSCTEDAAVKAIKGMISAGKSTADSFVFSVRVAYTDPSVVYDAISAIQYAMVEIVAEVNNDYSGNGSTKYITLINEIHSEADITNSGKSYLTNAVIFGFGAFFICYVVCFVLLLNEKKVFDRRAIKDKIGGSVGASISGGEKEKDTVALATDVEYSLIGSHNPAVAVAYDQEGTGAREFGMLLAAAYASKGLKALLVDFDMNSGYASSALALEGAGVSEYLCGSDELQPTLTEKGFYAIGRGNNSAASALHNPDRLNMLLERCKSGYDVIVADIASPSSSADSRIVASVCDGCLLTVSQGVSTLNGIDRCTEKLSAVGATIIGYAFVKRK